MENVKFQTFQKDVDRCLSRLAEKIVLQCVSGTAACSPRDMTGRDFVVLSSSGVKREGDNFSKFFKSKDEAIDNLGEQLVEFAKGSEVVVFRRMPETIEWRGKYAAACRLSVIGRCEQV